MLKRILLACLSIVCVLGLTAVSAKADIVAESTVYEINGQPYEGYFAINQGFGESQPVVLLIHD